MERSDSGRGFSGLQLSFYSSTPVTVGKFNDGHQLSHACKRQRGGSLGDLVPRSDAVLSEGIVSREDSHQNLCICTISRVHENGVCLTRGDS